MIEDTLIERAAAGDVDAAALLDAQGLLVGQDESAAEYGQRLQALRANTGAMREALARDGSYEVEGVRLAASEEIPPELFGDAAAVTERLFAFAVTWVPGFFINPSFSLLFGGCAFYFYPDFFALFIIRKSFATRERWLIYSRRELLSHELCHVARLGLMSTIYEETFAYQTATSRFRRVMGSVFRSPADSFLFLGVTLLLLLGQVVRTLLWPALWIAPFWLALLGVGAFFALRHTLQGRRFKRAERRLRDVVGARSLAVLFRCTDEEIDWIAGCRDSDSLAAWIGPRVGGCFRWQVMARRFPGLLGSLSDSGQVEAPAPVSGG